MKIDLSIIKSDNTFMLRKIPSLKSPTPPQEIYSREIAISAAGIHLHELQDWTRKAKRGYFEPTQPASGQGTRQGFAFRDLLVLRLIRLLKIANVRQHLISDIIDLLNSSDVQNYFNDKPQFNFLDEGYIIKSTPSISEKKEGISFWENRYSLHLGLTQDRDPSETIQLNLSSHAFKIDEDGNCSEILEKKKNIWFVASHVAKKFKNSDPVFKKDKSFYLNSPNRFAFTSQIDLTYIHNIIMHLLNRSYANA